MVILALDYGTKNIGTAICDKSHTFAWAKETISNTSFDDVVEALKKMISEENIEKIIIGLPLGNENKPTQMSHEIEAFVENVKDQIRVPIVFWNEMLTTKQAISTFKQSRAKLKDKDTEAARIILQEYLDHTYGNTNNTKKEE